MQDYGLFDQNLLNISRKFGCEVFAWYTFVKLTVKIVILSLVHFNPQKEYCFWDSSSDIKSNLYIRSIAKESLVLPLQEVSDSCHILSLLESNQIGYSCSIWDGAAQSLLSSVDGFENRLAGLQTLSHGLSNAILTLFFFDKKKKN